MKYEDFHTITVLKCYCKKNNMLATLEYAPMSKYYIFITFTRRKQLLAINIISGPILLIVRFDKYFDLTEYLNNYVT